MKLEDLSLGDILFGAEITPDGKYTVYEVEIIGLGLNEIECEILADDETNGAIWLTTADKIFEERKETLEYILKQLSEINQKVSKTLAKAQDDLNKENARLERLRLIKEHAKQIRAKLVYINELITKTFEDPLIDYCFENVEEDSDFEFSLDVLTKVLSYNLKQREEGWKKVIHDIFSDEEEK